MFKADTSYTLLSSSEFLLNIITAYIASLNEEQGILRVPSLFKKQLIISDTASPSKKSIVISYKSRDSKEFKEINIDDSLAKICFSMQSIDLEAHKNIIRYITNKCKKVQPEVAYYNVMICTHYISKLDTERVDKIFSNRYLGIHTAIEQYQTLVDFINNPTEVNLHHLLNMFNEDDFSRLVSAVSTLTNDTPEWLVRRFGDLLADHEFTRKLLKLAVIILKASSKEEFILYALKELIK